MVQQSNNDDHNQLENLENNLYSRNRSDAAFKEGQLRHSSTSDVPTDWADKDNPEDEYEGTQAKPHSFFKKFFYFSLAFFVLALGIAAFVYFRGADVVSADNVDISVAGPVAIEAGQELDLDISVKNQNNVALNAVSLKVNYPTGTRSPANIANEQASTQNDLGSIPSGGVATQKVSAVLFGAQNDEEQITIVIDYSEANSSAIFEKTKVITVAIDSVPVTVTVSSLSQVNSGQNAEFDVLVASNSATPINNLLLTADYGFGFTFASSSPSASASQNVWQIGTLEPGEKETIKIYGSIDAQNGEDRAFHFTIGIASPNNPNSIETPFLTVAQAVSIQKPFLGINLTLNGNANTTYVSVPGQAIQGNIDWVNNLATTITGAKIILTLTGPLIDKTQVRTNQGFYDSLHNTITWDETGDPDLATVQAGESGHVTFSLASVPLLLNNLSTFENGQIGLNVSVSGERTEDTNVPDQALSAAMTTIHFTTGLDLSPRVIYSTGPFQNSGPFPPKSEVATTYTVIWDVTNTFNDASGVQVTATLPSYIQWLGKVSPSNEPITYDSTTGQITWTPGTISSKTGYGASPREVSFQIGFTPSVSQIGTAPILVTNQQLSGVDTVTAAPLNETKPDLTTKLSTDQDYVPGSENVTK